MKPPLIFLIVIALIAVLATRQFNRQRRENAANDAAPIRSIIVEVKSRHQYLAPDRRSRQREHIPVEEWHYEVLFQPLSGAGDIRVRLNAADFNQLVKGNRGKLSVQGTRFISFTPVSSHNE